MLSKDRLDSALPTSPGFGYRLYKNEFHFLCPQSVCDSATEILQGGYREAWRQNGRIVVKSCWRFYFVRHSLQFMGSFIISKQSSTYIRLYLLQMKWFTETAVRHMFDGNCTVDDPSHLDNVRMVCIRKSESSNFNFA